MAIKVACTTAGSSSNELAAALLLYKGSNAINFVSLHDVDYVNGDKSKPYIGPGKPVSKLALSKIMQELSPKAALSRTLLPENILSFDAEHLVWYTLPTKKQMWFKNELLGGDVTALVDIPGLIFMVYQQEWYVFAHKLKKRPSADTPLFLSPFMNVWDSGKICTGNIKVPKIDSPTSTEAFEDAFFRSYFTHINIHGKNQLVKYEGGPYQLWKQLITGEVTKFPLKALVKQGSTLGDIFDLLNRRNLS